MKYADNILDVSALQPDYIGFIFYEKSTRYVGTSPLPTLSKKIRKTGVFVNETIEKVGQKIKIFKLEAIQLHGSETPQYCQELRQKFPKIEIIKAFLVGNSFCFTPLEAYIASVNYFLFDTKGKHPGGNGLTFNWGLLEKYPYNTPFFLSGGIGIEEIDKIHELQQSPLPLYAIDLNSRFEVQPGIKNTYLLNDFISLL